MKYYSTNNKNVKADFKEIIFSGTAPDGGLFMPEYVKDNRGEMEELLRLPLHEKAARILYPYVSGITEAKFGQLCTEAFNFPVSIKKLTSDLAVAELFNGPTLAFKDFGARFLARIISYYLEGEAGICTIMVATSGDTGGAVANAFWGMKNVRVVLLYPSKRISPLQERQLTTLGGNVYALEVTGTFDDCQRLVKDAFADTELKNKYKLTSANSINFVRLLAQSVYYFEAFSQIALASRQVRFIIPSGNLGNLTAGILSVKMGLPVHSFIAALNRNRAFLDYLETGEFQPRSTFQTLSNAMDVGNPSNLSRLKKFFNDQVDLMRQNITAFSFTDDATIAKIKEVSDKYNYAIDPHTATGLLAYDKLPVDEKLINIVLSTAHPAKFLETMDIALGAGMVQIPEPLLKLKNLNPKSLRISPEYSQIKDFFSTQFN